MLYVGNIVLRRAGTYKSRLRARAVHRALAFCVQYVELDAEDVSCSYAQEHEPGPFPDPRSYLEGRDAAVVTVRRLLLTPQEQRKRLLPGCCRAFPYLAMTAGAPETSWQLLFG